MKALFVALCALLCLPAQAAIWGKDDRQQITPGSTYDGLGRATAVGVLSNMVEPDGNGRLRLDAKPMGKYLCQDEKFAAEPTNPYGCSGFLVAPDLLVTAGHCGVNTGEVRDEEKMYCEAYSWLFDFQTDNFGRAPLEGIPQSNFYRCKKILFAVKEDVAPFRDYTLLQLDRPVTSRQPLKIAAQEPKVGDALFMIGHPFGMPRKLSPNAAVTINDGKRQIMIASLDTFEGNSGSAVFNAKQEVVGILVGGTPSRSFVKYEDQACHRYNRCDEKGKNCSLPDKDTSVFPGYQGPGAEVQKIGPILELLKQRKQ